MLEKLKLRTQILIFLVSMMILITLIIVLQHDIVLQRSFDLISITSRHILQRQIDQSLNTQSYFVNRIVSRQFHIQQRRGDSVNLIYRFLDLKGNESSIYKPDPCASPQKINSLEYNLTRVCFGVFNSTEQYSIPQGEQYFKIAKLFSLVNQYSATIDSNSRKTNGRMYIFSDFEKGFASIYPTAVMIPQFPIQKTNWYQQQIQSGQIVSFSNLSFLLTPPYSLRMVITQSLLDKNLNFNGVIGIDLIFSEQRLEKINNNLLIINQYGQIVLANVDFNINASVANYIFNEKQSGFNQTDWVEIQKVLNGQQTYHQCQNGKYLCLFNSILQDDVQVIATKMQNGFISIMLSRDYHKLIDILHGFEKEFLFSNYQTIIIQIVFGLIILIITLFAIFLLTKPINNIINIVKQYTMKYGNNISQDIFKENLFRSILNQVNTEFDIVITIIKQQATNKNKQCRIQERFQFPEGNFELPEAILIELNQIINTSDQQELILLQLAINHFYNSRDKITFR
ncbi:hypothetical protein pb186bvf_012104 [Paramecium bursaria]